MLRTCIQQIGEENERLQSRISGIREDWNDAVSSHVEHTYIDALSGLCSSFYSEVYQVSEDIAMQEDILQKLAGRY